jgi:hypothetical protein
VRSLEQTLPGEWLSIVLRKLASLTRLQRMRRPFAGGMDDQGKGLGQQNSRFSFEDDEPLP